MVVFHCYASLPEGNISLLEIGWCLLATYKLKQRGFFAFPLNRFSRQLENFTWEREVGGWLISICCANRGFLFGEGIFQGSPRIMKVLLYEGWKLWDILRVSLDQFENLRVAEGGSSQVGCKDSEWFGYNSPIEKTMPKSHCHLGPGSDPRNWGRSNDHHGYDLLKPPRFMGEVSVTSLLAETWGNQWMGANPQIDESSSCFFSVTKILIW